MKPKKLKKLIGEPVSVFTHGVYLGVFQLWKIGPGRYGLATDGRVVHEACIHQIEDINYSTEVVSMLIDIK